jgi:hypothetical protein
MSARVSLAATVAQSSSVVRVTRLASALCIALLLAASTSRALAQTPRPSADSVLLARADSITVGDYCTVSRSILAVRPVIALLGADSTMARLSAATICDRLLSSFSLRALFGKSHAPMAAVARLHPQGSAEGRTRIFDAMSEFRATLLAEPIRDSIKAAIGAELSTQLTRVATTAQGLLTSAARDRAVDRLARYERKLGPTSARLNGIEVLLNYGAQRWLRGFRPDPLTGPSPWEVVASYAPGYVTYSASRAQPVSVAEFGVRHYLFGEQFAQPGARGLLYPSYWAIGVLTASDRNGALVSPWEGRTRTGGYVSWGSIKLGYVPGRNGAWLVSKQFQAVPFVF